MAQGRVVAVALLVLLSQAAVVLASHDDGQDDAGSGGDAPDTIGEAYGLPMPGTYGGNLTPSGDADWYRLAAVDTDVVDVPACLEATATGDKALADIDLTFDEAKTQLAIAELSPDQAPEIGLATPSFSEVYTGLHPVSANYSTGVYEFSLSVLDLDELTGDASTGDDAPSWGSTKDLPSIPSACFGGTLAENDTADAYSFQGSADERVLLTFTHTGDETVSVTLISPSGDIHGPYTPTAEDTVHEISLDEDGEWTMQASSSSTDTSTSYLTGFTLANDPEEEEEEDQGCHPYCFLFS